MRARLPWVLLAVTAVLVVGVMLPLSVGQRPASEIVFYVLLTLTFGAAGALIASRQPQNAIGWIFCAFGVWSGVTETWFALAYHSLPAGAAGEWVGHWSWILELAMYTLVFLLFPRGRLAGPRWRLAVWLLAAGCILAVPGQALNTQTDPSEFASGRNPLGVDSPVVQVVVYAGLAMVIAALAASVGSLVVKLRRAAGFERQQLKQLVFAAGVTLAVMALSVPFFYESALVRALTEAVLIALPIAVCVAIVRHRLYDIDVVIRRTVVYGVLTATLAGTYVGSVLLLQLLLSPGNDLAIAGSTLAVAALVRPARKRIQELVDRRFYRRRYDAAQTIEQFGARLRDEVELDALSRELREVVRETMQPAHASIWLKASR
jgi:hypothetical protein